MSAPDSQSGARRRASADGGPTIAPGALLRLPLAGSGLADPWAEHVPPVPDGHVVTVSFVSAAALVEHADALELLGYRVVAAPAATADGASAEVCWMVVSGALAGARPAWWDSMRHRADRVYSLSMGPVQKLFAPLLRAHLRDDQAANARRAAPPGRT